MVQVRFIVDGQAQLSRVLLDVVTSIKDWTPALSASAEEILSFIGGDVFDTEGDAIGMPWEPLSDTYAAIKDVRYPGQPILVATGAMRDSFFSLVEPTILTIGNSAEYFVYHQSSAPRTKLPRRVMLGLTNTLKEQVIKNFQAQLADAGVK